MVSYARCDWSIAVRGYGVTNRIRSQYRRERDVICLDNSWNKNLALSDKNDALSFYLRM